MNLLWVLGEVVTEQNYITGGAGWAGAGLLGLVLGWLLLKHLPDKDRQFDALIKAHSDNDKELHVACAAERKEQYQEFSKALTAILDRSSKDSERNFLAVQTEMQNLRETLRALSQVIDSIQKLR